MNSFNEELHFWQLLTKNCVRYIVGGDLAGYLHGHQYLESIIDLYVDNTLPNRQSLCKSFLEAGITDLDKALEVKLFEDEWIDYQLGNGMIVNVSTSLKGINLSFAECFEYASIAEIGGVTIPFLHINHLIDNKKAVNRPKDQIDVIELEKIKQFREESD